MQNILETYNVEKGKRDGRPSSSGDTMDNIHAAFTRLLSKSVFKTTVHRNYEIVCNRVHKVQIVQQLKAKDFETSEQFAKMFEQMNISCSK